MNNNSVYVHSAAISKNINNQVLRDGSSVLVRIISQKGDNLYEGSVFGNRVNIKSIRNIQVGSVFTAKINLSDGKIKLIPINQNNIIENEFQIESIKNSELTSIFSSVQDLDLENLLISMNLIPDNLSLHIVLQMKQLGLKFDSSVIKKIYNYSAKYNNKERKVAELITLLSQKKIDFDKENIDYFIEEIDKNIPKRKKSNNIIYERNEIHESLVIFVKNIFGDACNQKVELLSIMNHKGFDKDNSFCNWLIIPYEIVENKDMLIGSGNLRLLLSNQTVKKIIINCKMSDKEYFFCIETNFVNKKSVENILFNFDCNNEQKEMDDMKNKLQNLFSDVKISFVEKWQIEDNAVDTEEIMKIRGVE